MKKTSNQQHKWDKKKLKVEEVAYVGTHTYKNGVCVRAPNAMQEGVVFPAGHSLLSFFGRRVCVCVPGKKNLRRNG